MLSIDSVRTCVANLLRVMREVSQGAAAAASAQLAGMAIEQGTRNDLNLDKRIDKTLQSYLPIQM